MFIYLKGHDGELGSNSIMYQGVFGEDVDILYTIIDNGVKEDIIINKYTGNNIFDFNLILNGCKPELSNTQQVLFKDGDEIVGMIPAQLWNVICNLILL